MGNSQSLITPTTEGEDPEFSEYPYKELVPFLEWEKGCQFNNYYFTEIASQLKLSSFYDNGSIIHRDNFSNLIKRIFPVKNNILIELLTRTFYIVKNDYVSIDRVILTFFILMKNKTSQSAIKGESVNDKAFFMFSKLAKDDNGMISRTDVDSFVKELIDIVLNQIVSFYIDKNQSGVALYKEMLEKSYKIEEELLMKAFPVDEDSFSYIDLNNKFSENSAFLSLDYFLEESYKILRPVTIDETRK